MTSSKIQNLIIDYAYEEKSKITIKKTKHQSLFGLQKSKVNVEKVIHKNVESNFALCSMGIDKIRKI